ncbi:MAG: PAS domain-containing protein [Candidatus Omnitrophica bacterium]|nr:PAS domain-containing protein [Candidatus Omnitrophota bacterium]
MMKKEPKTFKKRDPAKRRVCSGLPAVDKALPLDNIPVVCIGASAGGLAAFKAFFSGMPADTDTGMAFVIVQHLAPEHKSILSELVGRYTRMKVEDVRNGMAVEPDRVYIIPPNHNMSLSNGKLMLEEPDIPRGQRLPIDHFFRSVSGEKGERAIAVILSGTGMDGTLGARAVKGEGGLVIAQDPGTCEYDGMPKSVIDTGLVDYVLAPEKMPARLVSYMKRSFDKTGLPGPCLSETCENELKKIFILLETRTGHDFSQYKYNTVIRRIERRMAIQQIGSLAEYRKYLKVTEAEADGLFRDLLIGVTNFFRDREVFKTLEGTVIPRLFEAKPHGSSIRVWVPGCSTGEEAYSIAILLHERHEALKRNFKIQVFATDIDGLAIDQARSGKYLAAIAADVTPERLARFFIREQDGSYRVNKNIRDMLVFSEQDVIKDPPFSKLDMISCRNLLIYLNGDLQKKLMPLFNYALNPRGILFLGTAETVGESHDLFTALDRKAKIYERKESIRRMLLPEIRMNVKVHSEGAGRLTGKTRDEVKTKLRELTERAIVRLYNPAALLLAENGEILYLHGRVGKYFELAPGESSMDILKMSREGLRQDLALALRKAAGQAGPVRHRGLRVKTNGGYTPVDLTVQVLSADLGAPAGSKLLLVVLEECPDAGEKRRGKETPGKIGKKVPGGDTTVVALKKELRDKEEYLRAANEELETANEELMSSNEEMQSINEEFQSTNEELETSKEELQSVNEELSTVNAELQTKVADLGQANNDLSNLLAATGIGTIFVDRALRIKRYTQAVIKVINLIPADVGRPVGNISFNIDGYDSLETDIREVLETLIPKEIEVRAKAGAWYLLNIRPYRTLENVIDGAVVTFVDITDMKKAREAVAESMALRHLAAVVRDSSDAIITHSLEGRILAWNPRAVKMYGYTEAEAVKMDIRELIPESDRGEAISRVKQLSRAEKLAPYPAERVHKDGRIVKVQLTATALVDGKGKMYGVSTVEREVSE